MSLVAKKNTSNFQNYLKSIVIKNVNEHTFVFKFKVIIIIIQIRMVRIHSKVQFVNANLCIY